jgi:hypothetical protein
MANCRSRPHLPALFALHQSAARPHQSRVNCFDRHDLLSRSHVNVIE